MGGSVPAAVRPPRGTPVIAADPAPAPVIAADTLEATTKLTTTVQTTSKTTSPKRKTVEVNLQAVDAVKVDKKQKLDSSTAVMIAGFATALVSHHART